MSDQYSLTLPRADQMQRTIAERTRRVYDHLSAIYPASTFFFHSKAHAAAVRKSGIENGMRVLEIATGSGKITLIDWEGGHFDSIRQRLSS